MAARVVLFVCAGLAVAAPAAAVASPAAVSATPQRQAFVLGLKQRGNPAGLASQVSNPASPQYRRFLSLRRYQQRFAPRSRDRRLVVRYLERQRGVVSVKLSSDRSIVLAVLSPAAGKRIFCARQGALPTRGLCKPRALRRLVRRVSAGEVYQAARKSRSRRAVPAATSCDGAVKTHGFAPGQLSTAYGVDALRAAGLDGSGIRVATLSSQETDTAGFVTWARCFGLATPVVRQFAMPGASPDTATAPEETVLDIEALASLAPRLARITPVFVPLDQGFSNSFLLFMLGALDPSRQGGTLPDVLSISDGVCESRFTSDELALGERLLVQAAALGITTLAASGDLGFKGCFIPKPGVLFPSSSPFATSVGGTSLTLTADNQIADQVVWSSFASQPDDGGGTGGGPSGTWRRPGYQWTIGPQFQRGRRTRLAPDIAAMGSFTPGLAVFDKNGGGWGIGGGTSASTPLTAAIVALVLQQERRAGRPRLGSLPWLLYRFAQGSPGYGTIFSDITKGTSSPHPGTPAGQSAAGGAAQPGYDLATGLGSLKAAAFAAAVAALPR